MTTLIDCIRGPRLYRFHGSADVPAKDYQANGLESGADSVIRWIRFFKGLLQWTSPVSLIFLYRRGWFSAAGLVGLGKFFGGVWVIYVVATFLRGIGRAFNQEYKEFVSVLNEAKSVHNLDTQRRLGQYDSEFFAWPVSFRWNEGSRGDNSKPKLEVQNSRQSRGLIGKIQTLPCHLLSYVAVHTFGRRMVFPGATAMQVLLRPILNQSRAKLVEEKNGKRTKLLAEDGNRIDTMFVDRRNDANFPSGNNLVICCEGNAGFYEIGCMVTPLESGYSVLGWNHPGFGGSTGVPFPSQEQCAVDVVVQYAIHRLGFKPDDIIIYAWSIGGYSATWAAMNYPDLRHVVLDATFDHLVPLAIARMPQSWRPLVKLAVSKYMNLNNAEQLCRYPGPILLIRRSKDEMITTEDPAVLSSNRGNDLLIKLLQHRYPRIVDEETLSFLREWCSKESTGQTVMWSDHEVDADMCESLLRSYILENSPSFPCYMGEDLSSDTKIQLTLFLASKYMEDYDAPHGQPLPASLFTVPWTVSLDL